MQLYTHSLAIIDYHDLTTTCETNVIQTPRGKRKTTESRLQTSTYKEENHKGSETKACESAW